MAQTNQPKKRKSVSKKEGSKTEKLTPQEIAFINRTELPAEEPAPEQNLHFDKSFFPLFEMFVKKLLEMVDTYGGFHSKAKIMEMYGMSKNTLGDWMKRKKLPFYQIDKKIVIKKSDMEEFLKKYRKIMALLIFYLPDFLESGVLMAA